MSVINRNGDGQLVKTPDTSDAFYTHEGGAMVQTCAHTKGKEERQEEWEGSKTP